jgi:hypothetical protein
VELCVSFLQAGRGDVEVALGPIEAAVAKESLDETNVSSVIQEMAGKTVAECMWADSLCDSGALGDLHDHSVDGTRGEPAFG